MSNGGRDQGEKRRSTSWDQSRPFASVCRSACHRMRRLASKSRSIITRRRHDLAQMTQMNPFPAEIWLMIFSHCANADLLNARLACRSLYQSATPSLFQTVETACFAFSIVKLQQLAKRSPYSRNVSHLSINMNRVVLCDFITSMAHFVSDLQMRSSRPRSDIHWSPRPHWPFVWIALSYLRYEQHKYFQSSLEDRLMTAIADSFPNLSSISLTRLTMEDLPSQRTPLVLFDHEKPSLDAAKRSLTLIPAFDYNEQCLYLVLEGMGRRASAHSETSSIPVKTLRGARIGEKWRSLRAGLLAWHQTGSIEQRGHWAVEGLKQLTHLELTVEILTRDRVEIYSEKAWTCQFLLQHCTSARRLAILVDADNNNSRYVGDLNPVYATISSLIGKAAEYWPALEELEVRSNLRVGDLNSLMANCSKLKLLRIMDCHLHDGGLEALLVPGFLRVESPTKAKTAAIDPQESISFVDELHIAASQKDNS